MQSLPPEKARRVRMNRFVLSLSKHWLKVVIVVLALYVGLSVVTPVLMAAGLEGPARALYTIYAPFCHQFAFRSIFIGGEQSFYPRAIAQSGLEPFEGFVYNDPSFLSSYQFYYQRSHGGQVAPNPTAEELASTFTPWMQFASKDFPGNAQMGFKMTLCARDEAIYFGLLIGALIYSIPRVRRRLRPVPILLFVFLGLVPIAIDGGSQLLGYPPFNLWPPRETLPFFRVTTGLIFGLMSAWLAFPYLEESFAETRRSVENKLRRAGITVE
ncbi:MAG TPA: DUF2085 domain-containing protein [Candidatus Limnocylindrales bacterium]|nr:DUF2085 domain-containing protein [Candidatus Limnocylindrales bacterium]